MLLECERVEKPAQSYVAGRVGEKRRRTQKTAYLEECGAYDKKRNV